MCSIVTRPVAVTTLPMGFTETSFCANAGATRKLAADKMAPVTKTAIACARIVLPSGRVSLSPPDSSIAVAQQYDQSEFDRHTLPTSFRRYHRRDQPLRGDQKATATQNQRKTF